MKSFLVSLGIIIFGICGLIYQTDMNNYLIISANLKALTEECAAAAAISLEEDEEALSEGEIIFDRDLAERNVNYLVEYNKQSMKCYSNGQLSLVSLDFYEPIDENENYSCTVKLKFRSNCDLFRLDSVSKYEIEHESCYEWI